MDTETRAYIAGIFDGEGCVHFTKTGSGLPILSIGQKDRAILDWVQEQTGVGQVNRCGKGYQLRITNRRHMRQFVRLIYPYSRVKRAALKKAYHHKYSWRFRKPTRDVL